MILREPDSILSVFGESVKQSGLVNGGSEGTMSPGNKLWVAWWRFELGDPNEKHWYLIFSLSAQLHASPVKRPLILSFREKVHRGVFAG